MYHPDKISRSSWEQFYETFHLILKIKINKEIKSKTVIRFYVKVSKGYYKDAMIVMQEVEHIPSTCFRSCILLSFLFFFPTMRNSYLS